MAGALKTLFGALQASTFLAGVTLAFGEEEVSDQGLAPPLVVMVPVGGTYSSSPGYAKDVDPDVEMLWGIPSQIDFYLHGFDTTPGAGPIDHADAIEVLRQKLLSALQDQRAQSVSTVDVTSQVATFAASDNAAVTWLAPFASTNYHVLVGASYPDPSSGLVDTWADPTTKTVNGITLRSSGEFSGTVEVLAYRDGFDPFAAMPSVARGLYYRPTSERWAEAGRSLIRYGRALVLSAVAEITVPMAAPDKALITSFQFFKTLTQRAA